VQADEPQVRRTAHALDRVGPVGEADTELRVGLACRDRGVGVAADVGRDPDQHVLNVAARRGHALEPLGVVQRVEHDVSHAGVQRELQLVDRLGVAVDVDAGRLEAGAERHRQLAAGSDVTREPLLGQHPQDGRARERLGREQDVAVGLAYAQTFEERLRAGSEVVLGDDIGRRAVGGGELDEVAAADFEVSGLVDPGTDR
jgi:hypothetical protein